MVNQQFPDRNESLVRKTSFKKVFERTEDISGYQQNNV